MFGIKVDWVYNFVRRIRIIYKWVIYMSRLFFKENIKYGSKNMENNWC